MRVSQQVQAYTPAAKHLKTVRASGYALHILAGHQSPLTHSPLYLNTYLDLVGNPPAATSQSAEVDLVDASHSA